METAFNYEVMRTLQRLVSPLLRIRTHREQSDLVSSTTVTCETNTPANNEHYNCNNNDDDDDNNNVITITMNMIIITIIHITTIIVITEACLLGRQALKAPNRGTP